MVTLEWNTRQDAEAEAQRAQQRQQEERQERQRRAELRGQLGFWRSALAGHEEALVVWTEKVRQAEAEHDAAWQRYLTQLHAETGGELPRGPGGQLITAIDMGPHAHPEAVAGQPARAHWQAYQAAEQALTHARGVVLKLQAAIPGLKANVTLCQQAGVR